MIDRNGWSQHTDPERQLARNAKAAGLLRTEYLLKRITGVHEQAVQQRWPSHRLDEAIADIEMLANEVWGPL